MIRALAISCAMSAPAQAADIYFCWIGANEYTMTGKMTLAGNAMAKSIVTAEDVTQFSITGYRSGILLGEWSLETREPDDTFVLNFVPDTFSFLPGDAPGYGYTQGWNADGTAEDCGAGQFGFNSGNYAQDFCLDGVWIEESGVAPATPFVVSSAPIGRLCQTTVPLS